MGGKQRDREMRGARERWERTQDWKKKEEMGSERKRNGQNRGKVKKRHDGKEKEERGKY